MFSHELSRLMCLIRNRLSQVKRFISGHKTLASARFTETRYNCCALIASKMKLLIVAGTQMLHCAKNTSNPNCDKIINDKVLKQKLLLNHSFGIQVKHNDCMITYLTSFSLLTIIWHTNNMHFFDSLLLKNRFHVLYKI